MRECVCVRMRVRVFLNGPASTPWLSSICPPRGSSEQGCPQQKCAEPSMVGEEEPVGGLIEAPGQAQVS